MNTTKHLITQTGLKKLKDELEQLVSIERKRIADDIQRAKEFGDLSENAAYASAMEARDLNESRIAELEDMLNNAKVVSDKNNKEGIVSVGDTVLLKNEDGNELEVTIVGIGESDPANHKVASDTPIASAILGKRANAKVLVELPGKRTHFEILKIK